ncbi:MAG: CocE/NonD family hydrolase [Gemmatimonadales bacterium]|jgi:putative CocE/NonD family hydrolase
MKRPAPPLHVCPRVRPGVCPRVFVAALLLTATLPASCSAAQDGADPEDVADGNDGRISAFGRYEGYSEPIFVEWVNTSRYMEMRDGVKLAVDVTFPAVDGEIAEGRFPVVWTHSRYHRNPGTLARFFAPEGAEIPEIHSMVDAREDLQLLVRHGYIVAAVQVRGGGASFGTYQGLFSEAETDDAREMIEWFATQPWSDGNVGMYGGSYLGITQYMAASEGHPALKAIFPNVAGLDMYDQLYPGGVYRSDMIDHWGGLTRNLDVEWPAPPVQGDEDGTRLLQAAIAEHENNWDVTKEYRQGRFRDYDVPTLTWLEHGPTGVLEELEAARVPAYHWNAWYDIFVLDALLYWANYEGPQRLGIGAWSHGAMPDSALMAERARLTAIEQLRWFDYWLKGIDNGIMDEPPLYYAVMNDPGDWSWESTDVWPIRGIEEKWFYFDEGPSGSIESVNDGVLSTETSAEPPGRRTDGDAAFDAYEVDLTTTTGTTTRWDNAVGGAPLMIYGDLAPNDRKSLTYTTPPLEKDLTVTGHPIVHLWMTSSTNDGTVVVLLEEVDEEGVAHYVTEGVLRASHRRLGKAPWENNLGLPFQRSFREDREPLPAGKPAELVMDLFPTATVFNAGHRLRVTIMGADADNLELPEVASTYRIYRSGAHPSGIVLPVVR